MKDLLYRNQISGQFRDMKDTS